MKGKVLLFSLLIQPFFSNFLQAQNAWNCLLHLPGAKDISFQLEKLPGKQGFRLINGSEILTLDSLLAEGDSIVLPVSVFDVALKLPANQGSDFQGSYWNWDARPSGYQLSFSAKAIHQVHLPSKKQAALEAEEFVIRFLKNGIAADSGILRIQKDGIIVQGTILHKKGDYRFLHGEFKGEKLVLSTFDGGHAFYFELDFSQKRSVFSGMFLSGRRHSQPIDGYRLKSAPNVGSAFRDTEGRISFSGRLPFNKLITQDAPEYRGNALVVQLLGTWCPNCLDETRFLSEVYPNRPSGVEFVGLAFEQRKGDSSYAFSRIDVVRNKLKVPYTIAWAGAASKDSALKAIPALGKMEAFPTTIFVRKDGSIHKIHSGFSGPATGPYFLAWRKEFEELLQEISR
jgi:thiol-disulfide isomerase/thioredoxin